MRLGMPTLIENASLTDACALCAEEGLEFIEINMNFPQYQTEEIDASALCRLMREYGVYFTVHLPEKLDPFGFCGSVSDAWSGVARDALTLAARINAPIVNMHLDKGIYVTLPDRKAFLYDEYRSEYMRRVSRFGDMCENLLRGTDTRVCIENTDGFTGFQICAADELLSRECFGLTLDFGHDYTAGGVDRAFYGERKDRLVHAHLHDSGGKNCHIALGGGESDLGAAISLIEERGCRAVLETKTVAALHASVKWLKDNEAALK